MNKKLYLLALSICTLAQEALAQRIVQAEQRTSCCPAPRPTCCEVRQPACPPRVCCPRPYSTRTYCAPRCRTRVCRPKRIYCPRIRCCRPKPVCCAPVVPPCEPAPCVNPTPDVVCSTPSCPAPYSTSAYAPSESMGISYGANDLEEEFSEERPFEEGLAEDSPLEDGPVEDASLEDGEESAENYEADTLTDEGDSSLSDSASSDATETENEDDDLGETPA